MVCRWQLQDRLLHPRVRANDARRCRCRRDETREITEVAMSLTLSRIVSETSIPSEKGSISTAVLHDGRQCTLVRRRMVGVFGQVHALILPLETVHADLHDPVSKPHHPNHSLS